MFVGSCVLEIQLPVIRIDLTKEFISMGLELREAEEKIIGIAQNVLEWNEVLRR